VQRDCVLPIESGGSAEECVDTRQPLAFLSRQVGVDHVAERSFAVSPLVHPGTSSRER